MTGRFCGSCGAPVGPDTAFCASCGTPVAAYPVTGPVDVLSGGAAGAMNDVLRQACLDALKIERRAARAWAERFSWRAASEQFASHLRPLPKAAHAPTEKAVV